MTPALDRGVVQDSTGIVTTCVDARGGSTRTQIDRLRGVLVATAGAELPGIVAAPAYDIAVVEQGTSVPVSKGEADSVVAVCALDATQRRHVLALVA